MTAGNFPDAENLLRNPREILKEKLRALEEYFCITEILRDRIETEDLKAVEILLARREDLIGAVDQINADRIHADSKLPRPVDLPEYYRLFRERTRELLEKTAVIESECRSRLAGLRDKIREDLKGRSGGLKVVHAYGARFSSSPRFMDVKH